ncbi:rho GTPase-activating protein 20-like [Pogoniulus pusillus]|uniref:rho GTPase-activating protein 20-like n=1 Tax=Pogoniulus pusillus TaxID=488313 RepID=UPI0030B929C8
MLNRQASLPAWLPYRRAVSAALRHGPDLSAAAALSSVRQLRTLQATFRCWAPQHQEGLAVALWLARDVSVCRGSQALGLCQQRSSLWTAADNSLQPGGHLPKPIQDLLALLNQVGPSTEGIFRLAASESASRQLREALDSGRRCLWRASPTSAGRPLEGLLRKILSKLLSLDLYQQWMSALRKPSRQEKVEGLKEVASELPQPSLLLLKSLLASSSACQRSTAFPWRCWWRQQGR